MSPKRKPRFWNRENSPLIVLGVALVLIVAAAGVVLWLINGAPSLARLTGL